MEDLLQAFIELFAKGDGGLMLKHHLIPSLVVFFVGIILAHFIYRKHIATLKEQVTSYQVRLGEIPAETKYTKLTNQDLKREAARLVRELRNFHRETTKKETEQFHSYRAQSETAQSEQRRHALDRWYDQKLVEAIEQKQERYEREFSTPIRALSTAIRERQPKHEKQYDDIVRDIIIHAGTLAGADPIRHLADGLEKQAEQLHIPPSNYFSLRWQDALFTTAVLVIVIFWALRQYALWHTLEPLQPTPPPPKPNVSHETNSTTP